jgi:hypothetical protein
MGTAAIAGARVAAVAAVAVVAVVAVVVVGGAGGDDDEEEEEEVAADGPDVTRPVSVPAAPPVGGVALMYEQMYAWHSRTSLKPTSVTVSSLTRSHLPSGALM